MGGVSGCVRCADVGVVAVCEMCEVPVCVVEADL